MAVVLVGEVVNSCDAVTGFSLGGLSGDDDFVEGTGAIGVKSSATTSALYTTTLGVTAPYAFSSGGGEFGWHIIMWFNTKTPINATSGLRIVVGNGTSRGNWYVTPAGFYKGGFITRVINTAKDFDVITAGSWTLGGNPAQLSNITQVGGAFTTITTIMGSFNNVQLDQMTIGLGLRVNAGTIGTPNTFETVRVQDEDTSFWGWWGSSNGQILGKGKLYIGPETGTATSVFNDIAFKVTFARENVASTFYEISTRGSNTDVTWELGSISSASPANVRWGLTIESDTKTFSDTNSVLSGAGAISLNSTSTLTGTTFVDCTSLTQNSATLSSVAVLDANTTSGTAFISSNNPGLISNCDFTFSAGHAIQVTSAGTYSFSGNTFTGYGANGTNDAAIYNNTGGTVTLNITGAGAPTVRTGGGSTTNVVVSVPVEINGMTKDTYAVLIGSGGAEDGNILLSGYADSTGKITGTFGGTTPQSVVVRARNAGIIGAAILEDNGTGFTDFTLDARDLTGTNDVNLYPATPAVNDAFYFGGLNVFSRLLIKITTVGTTYVLTWEYWNGSTWSALTVTDETSSFKTSGWGSVIFTAPGNWATTTVNSQGPYYYVRARLTTGGGTRPQAESITLNGTKKYLSFNGGGVIASSTGLVATAVWIEDANNS